MLTTQLHFVSMGGRQRSEAIMELQQHCMWLQKLVAHVGHVLSAVQAKSLCCNCFRACIHCWQAAATRSQAFCCPMTLQPCEQFCGVVMHHKTLPSVCKIKATPVRHTCDRVCSAGDCHQEVFVDVLALPVCVESLRLICYRYTSPLTTPPESKSGILQVSQVVLKGRFLNTALNSALDLALT